MRYLAPTIRKEHEVFLFSIFYLTTDENIEGRENARAQERERSTTG